MDTPPLIIAFYRAMKLSQIVSLKKKRIFAKKIVTVLLISTVLPISQGNQVFTVNPTPTVFELHGSNFTVCPKQKLGFCFLQVLQ